MNPPNPAIIPDFLDPGTCREVRNAMDRGAVDPAEVLDEGVTLDDEARRAASIEIDPFTLAAVEGRFDAARAVLSARCGVPLSGREGAGFIRYSPGGFYRPHRDRAIHAGWPGAAERRIAVVVFLNAEFDGGELVIYPDSPHDEAPVRVVPRQGSLVAFDAGVLHEVRPVAGGIRDVIVDWYYGPEA
jgi:predicted 2-oxoglutarate/Fe(II)-dependent dioxygenase YbiX